MKIWGWILLLCGVTATAVSFFLKTTVASDDLASSINNIGLLQRQMVVLHAGIGAAIVGAVLLVGGTLLQELSPQRVAAVDAAATDGAVPGSDPRTA
jgi:hypothetical protein